MGIARRRTVRVLSIGLIVMGALALAFVAYVDLFGGRVAMLCADPREATCSGQYVFGFPNELWPALATAVGVVGLVATRSRPAAR